MTSACFSEYRDGARMNSIQLKSIQATPGLNIIGAIALARNSLDHSICFALCLSSRFQLQFKQACLRIASASF